MYIKPKKQQQKKNTTVTEIENITANSRTQYCRVSDQLRRENKEDHTERMKDHPIRK